QLCLSIGKINSLWYGSPINIMIVLESSLNGNNLKGPTKATKEVTRERMESLTNMKDILAIDANTCTGCRNCELACSVIHTQTFNPARSRIRILKDENQSLIVPMVCLQCQDALCESACPTGAIVENEKGTLFVREENCIGCSNCVIACVYGGIEIDPLTMKAIKCDLCDGDPACVKACDYGAIKLVKGEAEGLQQRNQGLKLLSSFYGQEGQETVP
ncbi:MAG: 4Fe-4S dicluster domain-containing protein, partial [Candidatus Thorarchaeota archaeon]